MIITNDESTAGMHRFKTAFGMGIVSKSSTFTALSFMNASSYNTIPRKPPDVSDNCNLDLSLLQITIYIHLSCKARRRLSGDFKALYFLLLHIIQRLSLKASMYVMPCLTRMMYVSGPFPPVTDPVVLRE